jgi:hypothetical protein
MFHSNFVPFVIFVVRDKSMQWCITTKDTKNVKGLLDAHFRLCDLCDLCG